MTAPHWHALWIGDGYNPRVMADAKVASGAYAIRDKSTHEVLYVGESARGVIWKTLLRHFQAPDSFASVRETGVLRKHPSSYEVALHITSRGRPRPPSLEALREAKRTGRPPKKSKRLSGLERRKVRHTTRADQRAMAAQARWIARLKPEKNLDDGTASGDAFRALRAKQEAEEREAGAFGGLLNPGDPPGSHTPTARKGAELVAGDEAYWIWRTPIGKGASSRVEGIGRVVVERELAGGLVRARVLRGDVGKPGAAREIPRGDLYAVKSKTEAAAFKVLVERMYGPAPGVAAQRRAAPSMGHHPPKFEKPPPVKWPEETHGKNAGQLRMFNPAPSWRVFARKNGRLRATETIVHGLSEEATDAEVLRAMRAAGIDVPAGSYPLLSVGDHAEWLLLDDSGRTLAFVRRDNRIAANPSPQGALTELGKLTRLEPSKGAIMRWSLRQAPALAYDEAGRLFIVYTGKIVRSSTPAEMREYSRTHWGKRPLGVVRGGGVAPGPFVALATARSITYTTKKGFDSELIDYVHPFGEGASLKGFVPPTIVAHECLGGCGPRCAGRQAIALQGGTYRVTSRGIVG